MTGDERPVYLADRLGAEVPGMVAGKVSNSGLMAALGVDARTAALIRLCSLPRPERWDADLRLIAERFGLDTDALAAALAGGIGRAADGAATHPDYIAAHRTTAEVLAALDCDELTAARVRLCRLPRSVEDLQEIAVYAGVDVYALGRLLATK
jgi:hypothetical protein